MVSPYYALQTDGQHYLDFFITSHTSIWVQSNDTGVNKQFHWAMEHATKTTHQKGLCLGWDLLIPEIDRNEKC
jgi:hypothetical protein